MNHPERLLVGVLGNAGSGKTLTWNTLFHHEVRTGRNERRMYFNDVEYVEVFLLSRSPGKRRLNVETILHGLKPSIVLSSLQYQSSLKETLKYFRKQDYGMYIQWLNPGYSDENERPLFYDLEMITQLLSGASFISVRNGKADPVQRVEEIRDFLYGWALRRGLVKRKGGPRKPIISAGTSV